MQEPETTIAENITLKADAEPVTVVQALAPDPELNVVQALAPETPCGPPRSARVVAVRGLLAFGSAALITCALLLSATAVGFPLVMIDLCGQYFRGNGPFAYVCVAAMMAIGALGKVMQEGGVVQLVAGTPQMALLLLPVPAALAHLFFVGSLSRRAKFIWATVLAAGGLLMTPFAVPFYFFFQLKTISNRTRILALVSFIPALVMMNGYLFPASLDEFAWLIHWSAYGNLACTILLPVFFLSAAKDAMKLTRKMKP